MFLPAAILAAIPESPVTRASASVRIIRPALVSRDSWSQAPAGRRREIVRIEDGRPVRLRLVDFE